ncbi:MAG: ribonuclease R [Alphaproteobacteria bacterium]|nr:ribonuclease R [Alphaproteobacteria bacterium]
MTKQKSTVPDMSELTAFLNAQSGSISKRQLARAFKIKGDGRTILRHMLKDLQKNGLIERDHTSKNYRILMSGRLPEHCQVEITGQDSMGDLLGRPYQWTAQETPPQIIIVKNKINPPAGVGDIVQAHVKYISSRLYEGTVLKRLTHGNNQLVGMYENGRVLCVDRRITTPFVLTDVPRNIKNRDLILFDAPMIRSRQPVARFIQRIGSADEAFFATLTAIYMHKIPFLFEEQTLKQVENLKVPSLDSNRIDLTQIPFVTIDGEDARDFDDAVWAEQTDNGGFHIMIGIADVSWYVRSNTSLDRDAWTRGNSVYFPDRVIPMLPFELSNGVCSLKPHERRAALVCEIWIDKNGRKIKHRFVRCLIQSVRRLTYTEVQEALDNKQPIVSLEKEIKALHDVYLVLKKQRQKRGVMEIDVPEQEIHLNKAGEVVCIRPRQQTDSMRLIEELMILANVSAAETLEEKGLPTMYRVHDKPSVPKLALLNTFLKSIGLNTNHPLNEHSQAKDFNTILAKTDGTNKDFAINEFVLRTQSQAFYSSENIGHFGLSLERYAHFTSPIRRYADLMVHRALVSALKLGDGGLTEDDIASFDKTAQHISHTERQASSAEHDAQDRYTSSYLKNKVGKKLTGQISSVTPFGLFIRLKPFGADGFLPMRHLGSDFFDYDDEKQCLTGRSTGQTYTLGDTVHVILKECDPLTGSILLQPVRR